MSASVGAAPAIESSWSASESASRMPPRALRASAALTPGSARTPSIPNTASRRASIVPSESGTRRSTWQRETTVSITFSSSVVAKRNLTCGGGSSSVFSSALKAGFESMCTSSTM